MLRHERLQHDLTSQQLAIKVKASGVAFSEKGILRIEQGHSRPSVRVLQAIANILGWDAETKSSALLLAAGLMRGHNGWIEPDEDMEMAG